MSGRWSGNFFITFAAANGAFFLMNGVPDYMILRRFPMSSLHMSAVHISLTAIIARLAM